MIGEGPTLDRVFFERGEARNLNDVQPVYDALWVEDSPLIRRIPFRGSTETVTVPSSICVRRSPTNCLRHPRKSGRSTVRLFSFASTRVWRSALVDSNIGASSDFVVLAFDNYSYY